MKWLKRIRPEYTWHVPSSCDCVDCKELKKVHAELYREYYTKEFCCGFDDSASKGDGLALISTCK